MELSAQQTMQEIAETNRRIANGLKLLAQIKDEDVRFSLPGELTSHASRLTTISI